MGNPKLSNPHVRVIMVDGSTWDVQTMNPDLLAFERAAAKHKWPNLAVSPITGLTFLAWSAGRREGHLPATVTWEAFSTELCAEVTSITDEDAGADVVPPTGPAPGID